MAPRHLWTPPQADAYPQDRFLRGSTIRLAPMASQLGVAEGIETALAAQAMTGMAVWATGSASLLAAWEPPASVEHVTIWVDRDRSGVGLIAAKRLATRLERLGIPAAVELPDEMIPAGSESLDWLNVLRVQSENAN